MNAAKGALSLVGTVVIAGWVAYSVSAPRNVDTFFEQEQESLGGQSINQMIAESKAEADAVQCEQFKRLAEEEWNRSVEQGRDADMAHLDAQVARFCN